MSVPATCADCFEPKVVGGFCQSCHAKQTDHEAVGAIKPGTVLRDSYVIGKMIGAGNFGKTYKALHAQMGKFYVLKEFFPEGLVQRDQQSGEVKPNPSKKAALQVGLQNFLREAKTLVDIDGERNPEVVKVYDFFEANGTAYIVMPFLQGRTLASRIDEEGALPDANAIYVLRILLRAIRVAHRAGILHQDVKPENVYLVDDQQPVLIDFGNARGPHSNVRRQYGSEGFAPPEQYGGSMGPTGDIYAIGATIYACLTARAPIAAPERVAGEPLDPPISSMRGKVADLLLDFVEKAMQIRPEDRYASVDEVFAHLRPLLEPRIDWVSLLPTSRLSAQIQHVHTQVESGRSRAVSWNWGAALGGPIWFFSKRLLPVGGGIALAELILMALAAFGGELWFLWLLPLVGSRIAQGLLGPWILYRDLSQHVTQLRTAGAGQTASLTKSLDARLKPSRGWSFAGFAAGPVAFIGVFAVAALDMEAARAKVGQDIRVERLMCKIHDKVKATGLPPTMAELALPADQAGGLVRSYELEDAHVVVRLKEPEEVAGRGVRLSFDPKRMLHTRCENVDLPGGWVPESCQPGGLFEPPACN